VFVHCREGCEAPGSRETARAPGFLAKECRLIPESVRDFIDYWIENCVHVSEADSAVGAEQDVSILTGRCIETASILGLSKADLEQEVGNLSAYIGSKLVVVNSLERTRRV
jgi:hypothetical protein